LLHKKLQNVEKQKPTLVWTFPSQDWLVCQFSVQKVKSRG